MNGNEEESHLNDYWFTEKRTLGDNTGRRRRSHTHVEFIGTEYSSHRLEPEEEGPTSFRAEEEEPSDHYRRRRRSEPAEESFQDRMPPSSPIYYTA